MLKFEQIKITKREDRDHYFFEAGLPTIKYGISKDAMEQMFKSPADMELYIREYLVRAWFNDMYRELKGPLMELISDIRSLETKVDPMQVDRLQDKVDRSRLINRIMTMIGET